ncbi:MAG TPA: methyl-accepting chemotaxis protein, partial [Rhodocyclaceae bacterium]|nr:methyl-accepting chemotaxis protein [Rhodocyclaceae bacterium]HNE43539.1 methyl-accepting chemotaxis protein [Rhodocyclaceae bacterium]HNM80754.1 methyl-accepting chemotaxis protein [Rhodocyclaceae bacterium]
AAAAESLEEQAHALSSAVSVFRTGNESTTRGRTPVVERTAHERQRPALAHREPVRVGRAAPKLPAAAAADDEWEEF